MSESVRGSTRPADLETAKQLLHLKLTAPRDLDGMLARVTSDRVTASAKRFFSEKHQVFGVLRPATPAKPAVQ